MLMLAIDPGPDESGYVMLKGANVEQARKVINGEVLALLRLDRITVVAIESIESFGMPVGREVFETVHWAGRFYERALTRARLVIRVPRHKVKLHTCHDSRAKDSNIRRALLDRYGGDAAGRKGGPLQEVHGDCWQALALGLYVLDTEGGKHGFVV